MQRTPTAADPRTPSILAACLGISLGLLAAPTVRASATAHPEEALRIVATDRGFEHPPSIPAGPTHLVFENHGSTIHEAMLIRLPEGMTGEDYLAAVRGGSAFPEGALDYSGPGLTSPGRTVELWLRLDPGTYLLACWFRGHLEDMDAHTLEVRATPQPRRIRPPRADAVIRMSDFQFDARDGHLSPRGGWAT